VPEWVADAWHAVDEMELARTIVNMEGLLGNRLLHCLMHMLRFMHHTLATAIAKLD
jgi:hypothetical protein